MSVQYLDPAAESGVPVEAYELFLDLERRPLTVGLIANAFPDATNFMDCLEEALTPLLPGVRFARYQKATVHPIETEQLAELAAACDGAIAAWGH